MFDGQSRATKERAISFRLSDQEYERIEEVAFRSGNTPNVWSRKLVLSESQEGFGLTASDAKYGRQVLEKRSAVKPWLMTKEAPEEMYERV